MDTIEQKKVTANDTIIMMVQAINSGNQPMFYKAVENYKNTFGFSSDIGGRIKRLFDRRPMEMVTLSQLSHKIKNLIISAGNINQNVFMNDEIQLRIDELVEEWKCIDEFRIHNIPTRTRILLYGPTGNGKTTIAREIARASGRDFIEVNSDAMTESHLGATAANINKLLNEIKIPCVLFWDEIDSIGASRMDSIKSSADQENNRSVNSLLVNIEKMSDCVILVAATNRKDSLDIALIRRFDEIIEIKNPNPEEMLSFRDQLGVYYDIPEAEWNYMNMDNCSNFSDIKREFTKLARRYILRKNENKNNHGTNPEMCNATDAK